MRWWYVTRAWIRSTWMRRSEEEALDEEIRFHIEMETRKLEASGLDPTEARRLALLAFGGTERTKERTRDERGSQWLFDAAYDLRHAARGLRRAPAFALVSILTLAVGIGATSAMYTLVDGVLLRPLPYPESERILSVWERDTDGAALPTSYLNFIDWRMGAPQFEAMAAFVPPRASAMITPDGGVRARVTAVTADFFEVGGVAPIAGRLPSTGEHLDGGPPVAVVSRAFWDGPLGGGVDFDGRTLNIDGIVYDVVGVMPPSFDLPRGAEVWTALDRAVPWNVRANHVVHVLGRLAPGAEASIATESVERTHAAIRQAHPEVETPGVVVRAYLDDVVGESRRALGFLLGASGVLLLIACANVASTLLARGTTRVRELGVRASLGAGRGRIVRRLFVESLLLAVLGAGLGVLLGQAILELTRGLGLSNLPRMDEVRLDLRVVGFSVAVMGLAATAFGLLPALALTRHDLAAAARSGRSDYGRTTRRVWRGVMAAEAGLAVFLLTAGGLFSKSLASILDRDGGFDSSGVVVARLDLPNGKFESLEEGGLAVMDVLDRIGASPGVRTAGVTFALPLAGSGTVGGQVELEDGTRTDRTLRYGVADAAYFEALGIPLVRGRLFEPTDATGAPHVAVIDEAMARALWPGMDPIGRTFNPGGMDPWPDEGLTVIGVVGDVAAWDASVGEQPGYYVHVAQRPLFPLLFGVNVVVKTTDGAQTATDLREAVAAVDSDIAVRIDTMTGLIEGSASNRRLNAFVLTLFAVAALVLAAAGVYGVVAYSVARRTREMGIRLALGARPGQVRSRVQGEVLTNVAGGVALGVLGLLALGPVLAGLLYGVSAYDPTTIGLSVAGLGAVAWVSSWIPAWRGTRVDPARVLGSD